MLIQNIFSKNLLKVLPCVQIHNIQNELICSVSASYILPTLLFLRDNINCQFKILSSLTATDFPEQNLRFEISYELLSIRFNTRIRIKTYINELTPLDSCVSVFSSGD
jgi:NADH dehydrogenase (ubiquinone) Fe-S protein 3